MKNYLLFLILIIASFQVGAATSDLCGVNDSCVKKERHKIFFSKKTYLVKGYGHTCKEAKANANEKFENQFGVMDQCGMFAGPFAKGTCSEQDNGEFSQWIQCPPASKAYRSKTRGRCVMIGGLLSC